MNTNTLVTVLMPVYNGERFLRQAIESILQQTYNNFEFIIINDGSTDASEEIILSYTDSRIKYIKNEQNIKLIATLNKGFAIATGKYIVRMDADDYSLKERIEKQVGYMEANPDVAMAGSWFEEIDENSQVVKTVKYESDLNLIRLKMLYQTQFSHPTVILRKAVTDPLPVLFDPAYIHAEDYELFSRIAYNYKVYNLPQVLVKYRMHSSNVSVVYKNVQIENSLKIRMSNFKAVGVDATTDEVMIFEELAHQNYSSVTDKLALTEGLLVKMMHVPSNDLPLSKQFLTDYCKQAWFNICFNLAGRVKGMRAIFFNSEITKKHFRFSAKLRFAIKNFVKR